MKKIPKYCTTCPCAIRHGVTYENVYRSDVLILSDHPYDEDILTNSTFSYKEKNLINSVLKSNDLKYKEICFANACRCKLDKKKDSTKMQNTALTHCKEILKLAIQEVKPKIIIALGAFALKQMLGKQKIMENRGKTLWSKEFNCWIFVTVHPNYCTRGSQKRYPNIPIESMTSKERIIFKDFQLAKAFIDNNYKSVDLNLDGYKKVDDISMVEAKYVSLDTETTGLDLFKSTTKMLCIGFSIEEGKSQVIIL